MQKGKEDFPGNIEQTFQFWVNAINEQAGVMPACFSLIIHEPDAWR